MKVSRALLASLSVAAAAAGATATATELFVGPDPAATPVVITTTTPTPAPIATATATPRSKVAPWLLRAAPWMPVAPTPAPTPFQRDPCPGCGMG